MHKLIMLSSKFQHPPKVLRRNRMNKNPQNHLFRQKAGVKPHHEYKDKCYRSRTLDARITSKKEANSQIPHEAPPKKKRKFSQIAVPRV